MFLQCQQDSTAAICSFRIITKQHVYAYNVLKLVFAFIFAVLLFRYVLNLGGSMQLPMIYFSLGRSNEYQPKGGDALLLGSKGRYGS